MPLFRQSEARPEKGRVKKSKCKIKGSEDEASLTRLCLLSLAENMKEMWVKDYAQNYMDQYFFRYIMGPFSQLPGELLEELVSVLSSRHLMTRAALHLLLVPQLRCLSLGSCSSLVTNNLCALIGTRCQALISLDLSGVQNVSGPVLCELLGSLPCLHSLSLAGSVCDDRVLAVLGRHCPMLRHLDVSRCRHLSPAGLLSLAYQDPHGEGLKLLSSLLALDIGFGESERDSAAAAAFLLLTLPRLERVALEALGQACGLIQDRDLGDTEDFTTRVGVPNLREVWEERVCGGSQKIKEEENDSFALDEETDKWLSLETSDDEDEGEIRGEDGAGDGGEEYGLRGRTGVGSTGDRRRGKRGVGSESDCVKLSLREAQGVSFASLEAVGRLCPELRSLLLDCHEEESEALLGGCLARGMERWSGQLRSLSVRFPGPLSEMVLAVQPVGASLLSLTLEGVRADGHNSMLELLRLCPKLMTLTVHIEPPSTPQEEEEEGGGGRPLEFTLSSAALLSISEFRLG